MNQIKNHKKEYFEGVRDATPIAIGYFAVCFSLGIAMKNIGLTPLQGFMMSILNNASAGQYAGILAIAGNASLIETAIFTFVANARYLLMSCAFTQKLSEDTTLLQRLIIGFDITDELFGISIARPGYLNPYYFYGAMTVALPGWAFGAVGGILAGSILPTRIVSALSVALYGMFLAIIIPQTKKDKVVACFVVISFITSWLCSQLPIISALSEGTRTLGLTVILATIAAILFPRKDEV